MRITKFGHACLLVEEGDARILIDPGLFSKGYEELSDLDAVLVTHQHQDHVAPETLAKIRIHNPDVAVYGDEGTVRALSDKGDTTIKAVHAGEEFPVAGVKVSVHGSDHAVIHPSIPSIENVGYMIGERFFYPGDTFTVLSAPVEILALPIGAPWLKISEVIDYVQAVKPAVAIPVHDAVLAMPAMHVGIVEKLAPEGTRVHFLADGEMAEL